MKQLITLLFSMILILNNSTGQVYTRADTTLAIFKINDSLKYFEFYTPSFPHSNVGTGILSKVEQNVYKLKYADASNYNKFILTFNGDSVNLLRTSNVGYIPYSLERNKNTLAIIKTIPEQKVPQFHLNHPIYYKVNKKITIKVYKYPCFESECQSISFKKGNLLEQKWGVGIYKKYKPIRNKSWIAVVCKDKFIGWLLLSDADAAFERIEP
ncbi:MAG TPA: hypothetical protein VL053_11535 [Arachidicoccus sp.]|nr:hypothetical protein [Arachidicoccus sp.]